MEFRRRARQQENRFSVPFQMDARSGAEAVRNDVGSGGKVRLPVPVERRGAGMELLPPCRQMRFDLFVPLEGKPEIFRDAVLGDVVGGRAEPAGRDDRVRFGIGVVEGFENAVAPVRNFERKLRDDADSQEPFSEERQIRVYR